MAQYSRSRSGGRSRSSGGARRSGGGGARRSGGGSGGGGGGQRGRRGPPPRQSSSAAPMAIAILAVGGIIVLLIVLNSGKDDKAKETVGPSTTPAASGPVKPDGPVEKPRLPVPNVSPALQDKGNQLVQEMENVYKTAAALADEAKQAQKDGRRAEWQDKLQKAHDTLSDATDLWNEIVAEMPSNADWDEDQVADHYFGKIWTKIGKLKATFKTDLTSK